MRRFAIALAILAVGSTAVGCGDEGDRVQLSVITGELREQTEQAGYAFEGEEITSPGPTIRAPAGAEVTIVLENVHGYVDDENIPHDIMIVADRRATPPVPLFEGADMELLEAGQSGSITFTADRTGRFAYICALSGHVARGMYGEFIVE